MDLSYTPVNGPRDASQPPLTLRLGMRSGWFQAYARGRLKVRLAKIFGFCVSGWQKGSARLMLRSKGDRSFTMGNLPDHGLPLVQLKEQRRDLVVALQNGNGPVSGWELMQIAAIQQAIQAFEDGITDLDAEMEAAA